MFEHELAHLHQASLLRRLTVVESYHGARIQIDGKSMLLMCSNDYLGLAGHPELRKAASEAMERYGFGSGASRLISGTSSLHRELEARLARFKGAEAAIVFNSGYAANTGIIPAIAGTGDVILSDSLNHASIIDGCRLSRAEVCVFRHKDVAHAEALLKNHFSARHKLIVTDGVFSMDGDTAPLPALCALAEQYGAILMVDDAHGTGVLGRTGRGTMEHFGLSGGVHVQMGTLGKALGSFGAYAAGSRDLIDLLVNRSRSFMYSTALPPAVCAASLAAIDIIDNEPELREKLWMNRERFVNGLRAHGLNAGDSETPIIPISIGDAEKARSAADRLFNEGVFAAAIRPPTVPPGQARIRVTVTAQHSAEDVDEALEAFGKLSREGFM